jgi:hypothetical protein
MDGLSFITAPPPVESDPARADIACFIGFVAQRGGDAVAQRAGLQETLHRLGWLGPDLPGVERVIPVEIVPAGNTNRAFAGWLGSLQWKGEGDRTPNDEQVLTEVLRALFPVAVVDWWSARDYLNSKDAVAATDLLELRNVPVPIDTWDVFDALFAWDNRSISDTSDARCDTALGAAIRSFFAQGGRKCFVVRLGDPWPVLAPVEARAARRSDYGLTTDLPLAVHRNSWRGLGHLFALPEVSFLCLPDLPGLFGVTPLAAEMKTPPRTPEVFVECSANELPPRERNLRGIPAPRCDEAGFAEWADLVRKAGEFLRRSAREVQFVAAIPLPVDAVALGAQSDIAPQIRAAVEAQWRQVAEIKTAFVQLAYPWVQTPNSPALPGGVEAPDGIVAGALANSALTRGSWRSAIRQPITRMSGVEPMLDRAMLARSLTPNESSRFPLTLRDRVTVIGPVPGGFRLLSDVTTDDDEAYRPANVNRLMNAIVRAAREAGTPAVFQNSGPVLWNRLRDTLSNLLASLWAAGALGGASAEEAYEVRCDRSTMTQADLDAGRVVCRATFTAASPIVQITVVFAMDEGGQVSLIPQAQAA